MEQVSSVLMPLVALRRWVFNWPDVVYDGLIWLMVFVTIVSFSDYFFRFMVRQLRLSHHDHLKPSEHFMHIFRIPYHFLI